MRKRFALIWAMVVLGAALTLPATTAAGGSGYTYKIIQNYCYGYNGNSVYFKAKQTAAGWTNANYLTIDSWAQRLINGRWQSVYTWNQSWYSYNWNGSSHWLKLWRSYDGNGLYWFRIVFKLRVWQNNTLLATKTIHSVKC